MEIHISIEVLSGTSPIKMKQYKKEGGECQKLLHLLQGLSHVILILKCGCQAINLYSTDEQTNFREIK